MTRSQYSILLFYAAVVFFFFFLLFTFWKNWKKSCVPTFPAYATNILLKMKLKDGLKMV